MAVLLRFGFTLNAVTVMCLPLGGDCLAVTECALWPSHCRTTYREMLCEDFSLRFVVLLKKELWPFDVIWTGDLLFLITLN